MIRALTIALGLAVATAANAQQLAPQTMVRQLIANDANIKAALAIELDKANARIAALMAENEALKKAQDKTEAKKP
jgi:hypothetical protein